MSARPAAIGSGVLVALALGLSGCGGGPKTITVGGARPAAPAPAPAPALASAKAPAASLRVGPGAISARLVRDGYKIGVRFAPNRATGPNGLLVTLRDASGPVRGAHVRLQAAMAEMDMGTASYRLIPSRDGYRTATPAWQMTGHWLLALTIAPPGHAPVRVVLDDVIN